MRVTPPCASRCSSGHLTVTSSLTRSAVTGRVAAQVFHLKEAGIECGYLSGTMTYEESRQIMNALQQQPPEMRIVFVTPEKVARSDALMRLFDSLAQVRLLVSSRFRPPARVASRHPTMLSV